MFPVLKRPGRGFDVGNLDVPVRTSVALAKGDIAQLVQTAGGNWATCTGAGAGSTAFTAGTYVDAPRTLSKTAAFASLPNSFSPIAVTGATFTTAGPFTLTKTGAFAAYTFTAGVHRVLVTAGTGATVGIYTVASRVSDDAIRLSTTIGAGADGQTDIGFTLAPFNGKTRLLITGGTAITAGVTTVALKLSDDLVALETDIGTGAADVAFTMLDQSLVQGIFGCALHDAAANSMVTLRVIGPCKAFTKNTSDAAIAAGNLYGATSAKDLDSSTIVYGVNAKLVAKAVETALVSTTATRALRTVIMNGLHGWGGTYGGAA